MPGGSYYSNLPSEASLRTAAMGFKFETYRRLSSGANSAATAGTQYYALVALYPGVTYSGLAFDCTTAGNLITLFKVGLLGTDGTILASSATDHANYNTGTGIKTTSFSATYTPSAPVAAYACFISVGGTGPTFVRGNGSTDAQQYSTNAFDMGRKTGQTDLVASVPAAGSGPGFWMAGI